ncbi:unnamed protein product [Larinioides sclopetarius]|uniref:CRAL-TRIO domain-containing protein n=1 Tax=Larinioides sclopetarius TaxID=280406 RepID=A0AAV2AHS6_9ARAC
MAASVDNLEFNNDEYDDDRLNSVKTHIGEEIKRQSLNELKSLLTESSGLRPCLDDNFLLRFLRGARYRPNIALKRLKTYYFSRNLHQDIFQNYLPSNTLPAQALNHIKALPYRAKNLSAVVVIKLGQTDFQNVPFIELLRLELMVFETLMQNPVTQLCGLTIIIDCDGFSQSDLSEIANCLPACYDVFHVSRADLKLLVKYRYINGNFRFPTLQESVKLGTRQIIPSNQWSRSKAKSICWQLQGVNSQVMTMDLVETPPRYNTPTHPWTTILLKSPYNKTT